MRATACAGCRAAAQDGIVSPATHLLVPIKPLHLAKSRLVRAADRGTHTGLVAAIALDTVTAARQAEGVAEVIVVTSDPTLVTAMAAEGIEVLADSPSAGLNAALRHGDEVLRRRDPAGRIGALLADLPALRAVELAAALAAAGPDRAFCADRHGTGTTLLLAEAGRALDPRFGPGSAAAHRESGARALHDAWDSLRCDVDTEADLELATGIGLGHRTTRHLALSTHGDQA
jgi:2-phospho-L-lactate/phosphoenolpyruvate guanylyltransferase